MAAFLHFLRVMNPKKIVDALRQGTLEDDAVFDALFPEWARALSLRHWTPVRVGRWAASLLTEGRTDARVLDVGSGVGKFCIVGALTTPGEFIGVEQRSHFVELSREVAALVGTSRARFIQGNFTDIDWGEYNGIYLFNPFQENIPHTAFIDNTVVVNRVLYDRYTRAVEEKLRSLAPGTRVVTYFGFGGRFPSAYRRVFSTFYHRGTVEYWVKEQSGLQRASGRLF